MYDEKVSEAMHVLMAVHLQGEDLYLNQIDEIINHYGEETVRSAEENLYTSRAFDILTQESE